LAVVPLLATFIFSFAAFRYGSPGFRVDKTQHGLYISKVSSDQNPVQPGDLIVALNDMPYSRVLGLLLLGSPSGQGSTVSVTVLRDRRTFNFTPAFTPITWAVYLAVAWPHLLIIFLFLLLGTIALRHLRSPSAKSPIKLSLTAYWLTFAPYLMLSSCPT